MCGGAAYFVCIDQFSENIYQMCREYQSVIEKYRAEYREYQSVLKKYRSNPQKLSEPPPAAKIFPVEL